MNTPTVTLHYGTVATDEGPYHVFKLADPNESYEGIAEELAKQFHVAPDDFTFEYNAIELPIPDSVIKRLVHDWAHGKLDNSDNE